MDQIETIKAKTDIVTLIGEYLSLKKSGRNFKALCPFHQEKTPSFMVSPELQIFKCFGCGVGGDAIKFLQLYEKMDFLEAVEFLARRAGIKFTPRRYSSREEQRKQRLCQVNHLAAEFYHFLLTKHPLGRPVLAYLRQRGIRPKTIAHFHLGFSPLKPEAVVEFLGKKGYSAKEALEAGLVVATRRGQYWDRFRGRLIFPIFDHRGNLVAFSGRLIPGLSPLNQPKYINTPETIIYHKGKTLYGLYWTKQAIREAKQAIVVEGEFDLISPYQAGLTNIVALKGTAFTPDQAQLLKRFAEEAVLALDADLAGVEAVKRSVVIAEQVGLNLKVALLPEGIKDPDELAQKKPRLLGQLPKRAVLVWDFLIEAATRKFAAADPLGKKKILTEVLPFLARIENEVVKNHYLQQLARVLRVDLESVLLELEKIVSRKSVFHSPLESTKTEIDRDRRYLLEKQLLSLIFSYHRWSWLRESHWLRLIITPRFKRLVELARQRNKKELAFSVKQFFAFLPEELRPTFEEIYLTNRKIEDRDEIEKEIKTTLKQLEMAELRRQLNLCAEKIAWLEKHRPESKELSSWERRFAQLTDQLTQLEAES